MGKRFRINHILVTINLLYLVCVFGLRMMWHQIYNNQTEVENSIIENCSEINCENVCGLLQACVVDVTYPHWIPMMMSQYSSPSFLLTLLMRWSFNLKIIWLAFPMKRDIIICSFYWWKEKKRKLKRKNDRIFLHRSKLITVENVKGNFKSISDHFQSNEIPYRLQTDKLIDIPCNKMERWFLI